MPSVQVVLVSRHMVGVVCVDTFAWEDVQECGADEGEGVESVPCGRAGHTAAIVGTRMYVWSGREGYKKVWNNQVRGQGGCGHG